MTVHAGHFAFGRSLRRSGTRAPKKIAKGMKPHRKQMIQIAPIQIYILAIPG